MPRLTLAASLLLASLAIVPLIARQATRHSPPDFTGAWTLESGSGVSQWPFDREMTIAQDASQATVSSAGRSMTFRFDGVETEQTTLTVLGAPWLRASRASWAGYALVMVMRVSAGPTGAWEDLAVCALDGEGRLQVSTFATQKSTERGMSATHAVYRRR